MTDIQTTIVNDVNWLKHHIIALLVVALLVAGAVYGVDSLGAKRAAEQQARDTAVLNLQIQQTEALKAQLAASTSATAVKDAEYQLTIQQLTGAIAKQQAQLQAQLKINATLSAQQTADAIATKTQAPKGDVTASGDNVVLGLTTARNVNDDIDKLNTTAIELEERTKQLEAQTYLTTDALTRENDARNVIKAQDATAKEADKVCSDKVNTAKWVARKSKGKWFLAGVVAGFIGRQIVKP